MIAALHSLELLSLLSAQSRCFVLPLLEEMVFFTTTAWRCPALCSVTSFCVAAVGDDSVLSTTALVPRRFGSGWSLLLMLLFSGTWYKMNNSD